MAKKKNDTVNKADEARYSTSAAGIIVTRKGGQGKGTAPTPKGKKR